MHDRLFERHRLPGIILVIAQWIGSWGRSGWSDGMVAHRERIIFDAGIAHRQGLSRLAESAKTAGGTLTLEMVGNHRMNLEISPAELTARIRQEARRHRREVALSERDLAQGEGSPSLPPAPLLTVAQPGGFSCESLLAQTAAMVERARGKTTVHKSVPKTLRPLARNQGGFNDIVLEALERLREANRLLMTENVQLRSHVHRQTGWMEAASRAIARLESRVETLERSAPLDEP